MVIIGQKFIRLCIVIFNRGFSVYLLLAYYTTASGIICIEGQTRSKSDLVSVIK